MSSDVVVRFPGGLRVDAEMGAHVIRTDQPVAGGGEDSAPAPFDLFLASLATCAGIYALGYCRARDLPTEGLALTQRAEVDPTTKLPTRIVLSVRVPEGTSEKHRVGILRAASNCKVKKTLAAAPTLEVVLASDDPRGVDLGESAIAAH